MVEELLHYFCCFECNHLFAIGCVKGSSKHVLSVVAAAKYCNLIPCRFHPFSKHPICIRAGANTDATCIRTEMNSLKNVANMQKSIPRKCFRVFARVRIQAPHVFARKLNSPTLFFLHVLVLCQGGYFSYRAILVAIVSQNYFVLVFVGYRTIIARYVAKRGIAQMRLCETKYQRGGIAPSWGSANLP